MDKLKFWRNIPLCDKNIHYGTFSGKLNYIRSSLKIRLLIRTGKLSSNLKLYTVRRYYDWECGIKYSSLCRSYNLDGGAELRRSLAFSGIPLSSGHSESRQMPFDGSNKWWPLLTPGMLRVLHPKNSFLHTWLEDTLWTMTPILIFMVDIIRLSSLKQLAYEFYDQYSLTEDS